MDMGYKRKSGGKKEQRMLKQQVMCVYVCVVLGDNIRILWLDMLLFQFLLAIQEEVWPLSSGYRTGKGQFSFQSQRRPKPNNVQTTIWLCSFHKLVGYAQNPSS